MFLIEFYNIQYIPHGQKFFFNPAVPELKLEPEDDDEDINEQVALFIHAWSYCVHMYRLLCTLVRNARVKTRR